MPFVIVRMLAGRTDDQKRRLVKAITEAVVETTGAKAEGTTVVIEEIPRHHWAKAGVLLSDQE
jgi:4-oxalocrotonate tautomerase